MSAETYLSTEEAAEHLRVHRSFLDRRRVTGDGPKFRRLSARKILYAMSDLDGWAAEHLYGSTSDFAA